MFSKNNSLYCLDSQLGAFSHSQAELARLDGGAAADKLEGDPHTIALCSKLGKCNAAVPHTLYTMLVQLIQKISNKNELHTHDHSRTY